MKSVRAATTGLKSNTLRVLAAVGLAAGALGFGGCTSMSVRRDLDTIVAMAPAPVLVQQGQELRAAEAAAKQVAGAQAFRGLGESMEPLYVSGTAIVVMPCEFRRLRAGMSVVYVNRTGRGVAHVLTGEVAGGWVAQGLNNREEDEDLVTADNLVGVITQAYASADTPLRRQMADRALLQASRTPIVLNLPKVDSGRLAMAGTN